MGISRSNATDYVFFTVFHSMNRELQLLYYFKFIFGGLPISLTESLLQDESVRSVMSLNRGCIKKKKKIIGAKTSYKPLAGLI